MKLFKDFREMKREPLLNKIRLSHGEIHWLQRAIAKATKEIGYVDGRRGKDINGDIFTIIRRRVQYERYGPNLLKLFSSKMLYWEQNLVHEQRQRIKGMFYSTRDDNLILDPNDIDELTQLRELVQEARGCNRRVEEINKQSTMVNDKLTKLQRNLDGEDNE